MPHAIPVIPFEVVVGPHSSISTTPPVLTIGGSLAVYLVSGLMMKRAGLHPVILVTGPFTINDVIFATLPL
jgi:hypothetical protein